MEGERLGTLAKRDLKNGGRFPVTFERPRVIYAPGSLGSFGRRERSGAFGRPPAQRGWGRGKAVRSKSAVERRRRKAHEGAPPGGAESVTFEASSFKGNQTAQSQQGAQLPHLGIGMIKQPLLGVIEVSGPSSIN